MKVEKFSPCLLGAGLSRCLLPWKVERSFKNMLPKSYLSKAGFKLRTENSSQNISFIVS